MIGSLRRRDPTVLTNCQPQRSHRPPTSSLQWMGYIVKVQNWLTQKKSLLRLGPQFSASEPQSANYIINIRSITDRAKALIYRPIYIGEHLRISTAYTCIRASKVQGWSVSSVCEPKVDDMHGAKSYQPHVEISQSNQWASVCALYQLSGWDNFSKDPCQKQRS